MDITIDKVILNNMGAIEKSIRVRGNENEVGKIIEILNKLIAETK